MVCSVWDLKKKKKKKHLTVFHVIIIFVWQKKRWSNYHPIISVALGSAEANVCSHMWNSARGEFQFQTFAQDDRAPRSFVSTVSLTFLITSLTRTVGFLDTRPNRWNSSCRFHSSICVWNHLGFLNIARCNISSIEYFNRANLMNMAGQNAPTFFCPFLMAFFHCLYETLATHTGINTEVMFWASQISHNKTIQN